VGTGLVEALGGQSESLDIFAVTEMAENPHEELVR
jgi:hypothetical protein